MIRSCFVFFGRGKEKHVSFCSSCKIRLLQIIEFIIFFSRTFECISMIRVYQQCSNSKTWRAVFERIKRDAACPRDSCITRYVVSTMKSIIRRVSNFNYPRLRVARRISRLEGKKRVFLPRICVKTITRTRYRSEIARGPRSTIDLSIHLAAMSVIASRACTLVCIGAVNEREDGEAPYVRDNRVIIAREKKLR